MMIIDHRNYDFILDQGYASQKNIYYNVITSIKSYHYLNVWFSPIYQQFFAVLF